MVPSKTILLLPLNLSQAPSRITLTITRSRRICDGDGWASARDVACGMMPCVTGEVPDDSVPARGGGGGLRGTRGAVHAPIRGVCARGGRGVWWCGLSGCVTFVCMTEAPPSPPGDCVLQPPLIRHRVLRSSANLEVLEISSPGRGGGE